MILDARHSYIGVGIDAEVVHRVARSRMTDSRHKESTVVHHHPHKLPCKDHEHTVYTHADQKVVDKVYVDDPYEMWFKKDG